MALPGNVLEWDASSSVTLCDARTVWGGCAQHAVRMFQALVGTPPLTVGGEVHLPRPFRATAPSHPQHPQLAGGHTLPPTRHTLPDTTLRRPLHAIPGCRTIVLHPWQESAPRLNLSSIMCMHTLCDVATQCAAVWLRTKGMLTATDRFDWESARVQPWYGALSLTFQSRCALQYGIANTPTFPRYA